jgi:hypothetical protein
VAGNTNEDLAIVGGTINSFSSAGYNLIGTGNVYSGANNAIDVFNQSGDTTGVADPLLGALADNGGLTKTHVLLSGSLALDAGNPSAVAGAGGTPLYDQRGVGFSRVVNGRIDIGAFEVQAAGPSSADFDGDGDVDGRDFLLWQRGYGITAPNAVKADGDADNDTDVDGVDLEVWQDQYGEEEELSAISSQLSASEDEALPFVAAPANPSVRGYGEIESDFEMLYAEEVDRVFEQLAATSTSVRSFGEMVARRGVAKRMAVESVGSALE